MCLLSTLFLCEVFAQEVNVNGRVFDKETGEPLFGFSNSVFVEILCYFNYFEKVDSRAYYTRLAFRGMYRRKRI